MTTVGDLEVLASMPEPPSAKDSEHDGRPRRPNKPIAVDHNLLTNVQIPANKDGKPTAPSSDKKPQPGNHTKIDADAAFDANANSNATSVTASYAPKPRSSVSNQSIREEKEKDKGNGRRARVMSFLGVSKKSEDQSSSRESLSKEKINRMSFFRKEKQSTVISGPVASSVPPNQMVLTATNIPSPDNAQPQSAFSSTPKSAGPNRLSISNPSQASTQKRFDILEDQVKILTRIVGQLVSDNIKMRKILTDEVAFRPDSISNSRDILSDSEPVLVDDNSSIKSKHDIDKMSDDKDQKTSKQNLLDQPKSPTKDKDATAQILQSPTAEPTGNSADPEKNPSRPTSAELADVEKSSCTTAQDASPFHPEQKTVKALTDSSFKRHLGSIASLGFGFDYETEFSKLNFNS